MIIGRSRSALAAVAILAGVTPVRADQSSLVINTGSDGPALRFDWPAISVGVGTYEEGPTGLTVIRFNPRATVVVDSRGGAPGTLNTDALRLGYDRPFTDAVVFSGGSSYGEEAIASVATGLKEAGPRANIAFVPGAIIYDFGGRRLNEIYPDKPLAQAALAAAKPGVFPLGAQGAGRMAMQGGFFGCSAHSGQGAAFRQIGQTKIAAFVVVNASGAVTDRDGKLVSCHKAPGWAGLSRTTDLLQHLPDSRRDDWQADAAAPGPTKNTTISLIVTNRKLDYADLQRLAVQVHMSMGRAIQPFSTVDDGDTLFAASTQEVADSSFSSAVLAAVGGEVMWDAILASVPADPPAMPPVAAPAALAAFAGTYDFAAPAQADASFIGVGIELTMNAGAVTASPIAGGPAARAGVQDGDVITTIDGASLQDLPLSRVIDTMRGAAGSKAVLRLSRKDHDGPVDVTVTRELVRVRPILKVEVRDDKLWVEAIGGRQIYEFPRGQPIQVLPLSATEFYVPGRYGTRLGFVMENGRASSAVLNPGRWAQRGLRAG